jgi:hypothetical protein
MTTPAQLVAQGETAEGYSLLMLAQGPVRNRRYWWTCGGCWSRSGLSPDDSKVREDADIHGAYCSVHRAA